MKNNIKLKLGAVLSYIIVIANMLVGIIYTPILTQMLGQAEYGLYSLIISIINYFTVLDFGFGNAIIIYTARYKAQNNKDKEQRLHGSFFIIYIIIGLITTVLGLLLAANVNNFFENTMSDNELKKARIMMLIMTFNVAITFPFSVYSSIITAYEEYVFSKILNLVRIILLPIVMVPALYLGIKSVGLIIITTILNIIVLISNYIFCKYKLNIRFKFALLEKKVMKEIIFYSFFIFLNAIIEKVNHELDKFILGAVSGTIAVSIYAVSNQIQSIFTAMSTAISGVLLPKLTQINENGAIDKTKEFSRLFIKIGRIQFIVISLILSGFIIFGKEFIVKIWVGENYSRAYYVAVILMVPALVPLIQNTGLSILQVLNKYKYRTIIFFFIALLNIFISIPLAKKYDAIGAACGTSISVCLGQIIILNIYYWKGIKLDIVKFWKEIISMSVPVLITIIIGCFIKILFPINSIASFIIQVIFYTFIFMILMWLIGLNKDEKLMLLSLKQKVINKIK